MSSDEELVKLCIDKNREAQKALFEKYASKMMGICLRYTSNTEDAKDILQDGFVKVFTQLESFQFKSTLQTWMSRIFTNLAINRVTRGMAKYTHVDIADQTLTYEDTSEEMSKWGGMTPEQVLGHVRELPEIYRLVLNMYAVDGFSHQEIAKKLDISVGSSKSRLSRARVLLKERIKANN
ncbi:MAG: sigma-70 family RNA polymerase sigma factor [Bacteroidia bacterium]|nr:sigma-70 family RNA polymerase sigma factor [Bacteroidia bacterium]